MTKAKQIFVSNRLPFNFDPKSGKLQRGSGGLVSALLGVDLQEPFWWFGFETKKEHLQPLEEKASQVTANLRLKPVHLDSDLYDSYYDGFCNDVLWPLFHYESQYTFFQQENWAAYVAANQKMADTILSVAEPNDSVWIHDFHFMLLPEMLRKASPHLKIGFFLHTPFPSFEVFRQLPVRDQLIKSMIQCDLIGFHEHSYLRHFSVSLKSQLGIDSTFFKARIGTHNLQMGVYPISIDTAGMKARAASPEVDRQTKEYHQNIRSQFLILGVDRLDYTKGLELKLKGICRALEKYPELRGKLNFLQVAIPTRVKVPSYIRLKEQIDQLVGQINGAFGQPGYTPVNYIFGSVNEVQLLGLYRRADCLLVSSKRDGMNLVAIEYAISQQADEPGVVIVSEFAGVASMLGQALIINPWDEDSMADAIYRAFKMPTDERLERQNDVQELLFRYSASQWASSFLSDLAKTGDAETRREVAPLPSRREEWPKELTTKVRNAQKICLVLDYDGTVVQIEQRPELAVLSSLQREFLRELQKRAQVVILSGRRKEFLDRQFEDCPFTLGAEHGAFLKDSTGAWRSRISTEIQTWYGEAKNVMQAYAERVPLSFVEQKEAALVWHYRQSPQTFAAFHAHRLDEQLQVGLANQPVTVTMGNRVVEAKAIECNKGGFMRDLMKQAGAGTLFICLGDDLTDEDMFKVVGKRGISVKVGEGKTSAQYRLAKQGDVSVFLGELLMALDEKREPMGEKVPLSAVKAGTPNLGTTKSAP